VGTERDEAVEALISALGTYLRAYLHSHDDGDDATAEFKSALRRFDLPAGDRGELCAALIRSSGIVGRLRDDDSEISQGAEWFLDDHAVEEATARLRGTAFVWPPDPTSDWAEQRAAAGLFVVQDPARLCELLDVTWFADVTFRARARELLVWLLDMRRKGIPRHDVIEIFAPSEFDLPAVERFAGFSLD